MTLGALSYALLVAVLIQLAGLGMGWLALRPLRLGEPGLLGLWLRAAAGLGLLAMLILLIGMVGLLFRPLINAIVLGLAAVGLWVALEQSAKRLSAKRRAEAQCDGVASEGQSSTSARNALEDGCTQRASRGAWAPETDRAPRALLVLLCCSARARCSGCC